MKKGKKKSTENCYFYSHGKSLYIAWACFRTAQRCVCGGGGGGGGGLASQLCTNARTKDCKNNPQHFKMDNPLSLYPVKN